MKSKLNMDEFMKNDIVVKTNRLNESMHNLSKPEMELIMLAIVKFRDKTEFDPFGIVEIHASDYADAFEVGRVTAHKCLINAEKHLFQRQFTIVNDEGNRVKSRWISHVEYLKGKNALKIALAPIVIEHISRINGEENPFTQYHLKQMSKFKSRYATRLYELLVQWKTTRKTPVFLLKTFRFQMGLLPNEYERINNFKAKVLDVAVKEINDKTDLYISYDQQKDGRTVEGFIFKINEKKIIDSESEEIDKSSFLKMTDKQILYYAKQISELQDASQFAIGESNRSYEIFAKQIALELSDKEKQKKYFKYLEQLGFVLTQRNLQSHY